MAPSASTSSSPNLSSKLEFFHLIEKLKTQKRTGWVREQVDSPESIADHMYRMSMLVLLSEEDEKLDIAKCVMMAIVHDLAEASVGDITPFDGITKAQKQKLEGDAMHHMTHELLDPNMPASKRIHALWHEYEEQKTKEAKFVKDLDRIEMALQASEYEQRQGSKRMQPFFESSVTKVEHPEVQGWAQQLMSERRENHRHDPNYAHVEAAGQRPQSPLRQNGAATNSPNGLVHLASSSVPITDADDEIFDLYTNLSASTPPQPTTTPPPAASRSSGLGFLDSKSGLLTVSIDVPIPPSPSTQKGNARQAGRRRSSSSTAGVSGKARKESAPAFTNFEVEIQQDLGRLHAKGGDTGSVVWRAGVELARLVLTEHSLNATTPFLDTRSLASARVLELGSGTGTLSILLSHLVRSWTATDISALLPLIRKNISRNADAMKGFNASRVSGSKDRADVPTKVSVEELDWTWSPRQIQRAFPSLPQEGSGNSDNHQDTAFDLLLAVDCLFNESLVKPFVNVLNNVDAEVVVIVSELRSPDVLRLFLEEWLKSGEWTVWRACKGSEAAGGAESVALLARNMVVWVGWRTRKDVVTK